MNIPNRAWCHHCIRRVRSSLISGVSVGVLSGTWVCRGAGAACALADSKPAAVNAPVAPRPLRKLRLEKNSPSIHLSIVPLLALDFAPSAGLAHQHGAAITGLRRTPIL